VLALTDHDTMAGIPEAVESAQKYGIKIIPGVEISTIFSPRYGAGSFTCFSRSGGRTNLVVSSYL
ncbi:protein TrpH-like, partial [Trifolium medium]|nr:protein TrpH-like [Trifolium medium]